MRRARRTGPTRVAVRQDGRRVVFTFEGAAAFAGESLELTDRAGRRLSFPVRGHSAELDLGALAASDAATWELALVGAHGPVPWLNARWRWGSTTAWEADGRRALVTVAPGRTPRVVVLVGDAEAPRPRATRARLHSRRSSLRVKALVELPPHLSASPILEFTPRGGGSSVAAHTVARPAAGRGPCPAVGLTGRLAWGNLTREARHELFDARVGVAGNMVRMPAPRSWRRLRPQREGRVDGTMGRTWFQPRRTSKAGALGVYAHTLPIATAHELSRASRLHGARRLLRRRSARPLWLVGEVPFKAQDTGLAFFAHVVRTHPEIDARYVVAADSADLAAARAAGPVILADTPDHVRAALTAERIVGSHHPDYLFPLRTSAMNRRVRAPRVFLQHGVMGTKWMAGLYGRDASGFDVDQVHVSSPREKSLIIRDFGYREDDVVVTGLTRFDSLLAPRNARARVVIVPTWRDWIHTAQDFAESDFLEQWTGLLRDPRLRDAVGDRELVVMLHPNMRDFAAQFAGDGVRVIKQGEESLQEVLRGSELVVTDFSSVGFDAAIAGLPVVYFQFDRAAFLGRRGSHLDLDVDLPGRVAVTRDAALAAIAEAAAAAMRQSSDDAATARTYFPAMDRNSCERAFIAVAAARRARFARSRRATRVLARVLAGRISDSRCGVSASVAVAWAASLLPVRKDLVVFESERGRTYSGSPRALYRELCGRGQPLAKVWAVAAAVPDADPATSIVVPGSLPHAWALGRAGHWVSDQSQRDGIRRRGSQTFVQTWHGTPLKRMLHDALGHKGRDADYVRRATAGAQQWSVLLSANPHATRSLETAFRHRAKVLELGSPRNDVLFGEGAETTRERVRRALGVPPTSAMVLHAPTFRDSALGGGSSPAALSPADLVRFHERFGDKAVLVMRRHFLDRAAAEIPVSARGSVVDASAMPDASELMCAADVLITDYSSVFFDFLCTGRPILFFAPDLDDYRDRARGLYLDVGQLPGPMFRNFDDLADALAAVLDGPPLPGFDLEAFRRTYCPHDDGHCAQRVADAIFGVAG